MRSGISLRVYSIASIAAGSLVILNTWMQHEQFYPTMVALANSKVALFVRPSLRDQPSFPSFLVVPMRLLTFSPAFHPPKILGNVAIAACVLLGIGIKQFFLGTLRENEYEVRSDVLVNLPSLFAV